MSMCCVTSSGEKEGSAQSPGEVEDVAIPGEPTLGQGIRMDS